VNFEWNFFHDYRKSRNQKSEIKNYAIQFFVGKNND